MASVTNPSFPPNTLATSMKQIGVIVCSQRVPRAGLQISSFVLSTLRQYQHQQQQQTQIQSGNVSDGRLPSESYHLKLIDLADHPLPLYDEPHIPSQLHNSSGYAHAHTRAWSELIGNFAAFVFVTPQYNWGYPASIKNAIDYLYHEWKGKPAMVVSYGGHGGGKAASQLKQVLQGVRMKVVPDHVELQFPDREFMAKAAAGAELGLLILKHNDGASAEKQTTTPTTTTPTTTTPTTTTTVPETTTTPTAPTVWAKERAEMQEVFEELLKLLLDEPSGALRNDAL